MIWVVCAFLPRQDYHAYSLALILTDIHPSYSIIHSQSSNSYADRVEVSKVSDFAKKWLEFVKGAHQKTVIDAIINANNTITPEIETHMKKLAEDFTTTYNS